MLLRISERELVVARVSIQLKPWLARGNRSHWHAVDGRPVTASTRRMGQVVLSVADMRAAAREPTRYLLWVSEKQARLFGEPGWVNIEPPRDGAVLFVHCEREVAAVPRAS